MKILKIIAAASILAILPLSQGCSAGSGTKAEESGEDIEAARIAGREAARTFVSHDWRDTLELQGHLIEAGAKRATYDSMPQCRAAFDSTFISTIRTVRPEIARQIEDYRNRQ